VSLLSTPERVRRWLAHAEAREAAGAIAIIFGIVAITLFALRTGGKAGADRCEALLDRYVDFRARTTDEHISEKALDDRKAIARKLSRGDATCEERLSESTAKCAAEAPSLDVFERCFP
jgi:hypothetical protein